MRTIYYMKQNYYESANYYTPQDYWNCQEFTLNPQEAAVILLDINEVVAQLNICCGRITPWSREVHLCLLVFNKSVENSVHIEKRTPLTHLLGWPTIESQLSCIPLQDLILLLSYNP
jgi:hypothetical protein